MSARIRDPFDVVIVGGGVSGCSIAYHLMRRKKQRVLLLERGTIAEASTSRNAGAFRKLFNTETNIRLSTLSQEEWRTFESDLKEDIGYREVGYLLLASLDETWSRLRQEVELQRSLGVDSLELKPKEAQELVPAMATEDLLGAVYCPSDAQIDPAAATRAYARQASFLGADIMEWAPVAGIETSQRGVAAVHLESGERIEARTVVIAAGVWGAVLLKPLGLELTMERFRRELFESEPQTAVKDAPFVSDLDRGWYFLTKGQHLWMSGTREPYESWSRQVYWHRLPQVIAKARVRLPLLEDLAFTRARSGLYSQTSDGHAVLGWAPGIDDLLIVGGDSGHGVMHAPATGRLASELILDKSAQSLDIGALAPERLISPAEAV